MTKASNLSRVLQQHLQSLRHAGVTVMPAATGKALTLPPETDLPVNFGAVPDQVREPALPLTVSERVADSPVPNHSNPVGDRQQAVPNPVFGKSPVTGGGDTATQLQVLQSQLEGCTRCAELAESRRTIVFGVGNPRARLVLLGEAPGEREDRQGEPFVGAAGQLLDKILAACGLNRHDDVYILNTIKCRPPQNRNPRPEELGNCFEFAQAQLEIIRPEFICCLGSVAARTLLQTTESVGRLRKRFHDYRGSKVLVTYHPAYLLRTSSAKKHAWDDMQMLMREMGIPIPGKQ